jgi:hypothetical protein
MLVEMSRGSLKVVGSVGMSIGGTRREGVYWWCATVHHHLDHRYYSRRGGLSAYARPCFKIGGNESRTNLLMLKSRRPPSEMLLLLIELLLVVEPDVSHPTSVPSIARCRKLPRVEDGMTLLRLVLTGRDILRLVVGRHLLLVRSEGGRRKVGVVVGLEGRRRSRARRKGIVGRLATGVRGSVR